MIGKITRKSMRARWGRDVFIGLAIMLGVSFVAGSFVLADSLRGDVRQPVQRAQRERRPRGAGDAHRRQHPGPARPDPGLARRRDRGGRRRRHRRAVAATASRQLLDKDGDPIQTQGAPALGVSWTRTQWHLTASRSRTARHRTVPARWRSTRPPPTSTTTRSATTSTSCSTPAPTTFTIVGLVGLGNTDGFGGATLAIVRPRDRPAGTRRRRHVRRDRHQARPREPTSPPSRRRSRRCCRRAPRSSPASRSARRRPTTSTQIISIFGNGLLDLRLHHRLRGAFIINNVFGITISQRLRELALMRGVGASTKQVRRLIVLEALIISVTATVLGISRRVRRRQAASSRSSTPPAPASPTRRCMLPAAHDRSCRSSSASASRCVGARVPGPAGGEGPTGRGDAPGDRLRRDSAPAGGSSPGSSSPSSAPRCS